MGKQAQKKNNGKGGNGKVIQIDRLGNSQFSKTDPLEEQNSDRLLKELSNLEKMTLLEIQDAAVYSMHKEVRKKALDLLPDDWRMFRYVATYGCYSGTCAEAQLRMNTLQKKENNNPDG